MHTSFLRLPAAVLVSNVRGTMESRPCVHGCGRQSFGSHRHCCRYCGTGGHTRGCDRTQWQQQRDHTDSTPEQVPAKWRNWYEGAGHRLKALIVLIATSEQELSDREFTSFARRQLRAFHSDLNPTSTTAGECCRFLTEVLASS